MKLFAHAAAKVGVQSASAEMQTFFGLEQDEADLFLEHARSDAYVKDVAKLAKPPLTRIQGRSLQRALEEGKRIGPTMLICSSQIWMPVWLRQLLT